MEIDLDRPQTVYIVRNLDGKYCLHFDEPYLEKNGRFHSASGQWSDLEDFRWFLHGLNKGEYLKYTLNN